jgi:alpha,alpha-trehalose phosphorylase
VRGERFTVSAGNPIRVPLAHHGPCIDDPLPSKTVDRRPDGTLITASVPQAFLGR